MNEIERIKRDANQCYKMVMILVGSIEPTGKIETDKKVLENVKTMTEVIDKMLLSLHKIKRDNKDREEPSMRKVGKYCKDFLDVIFNID